MKTAYDFGRELIETKDLDPVYVVLHRAKLGRVLLDRWLLAYWCFYDVETSSLIADQKGKNYWETFATAAGSNKWKRATERRHFRGKLATDSVEFLRGRYSNASQALVYLTKTDDSPLVTAEEIMKRAETWRGFGPWISFKVADMLERLNYFDKPVMFSPKGVFLFDSPKEGAKILLRQEGNGRPVEDVGVWAHNFLVARLGWLDAPPGNERKVGVQETETVLCKWKSYLNGHYKIGQDIKEIRERLQSSKSRIGRRLFEAGKGELW